MDKKSIVFVMCMMVIMSVPVGAVEWQGECLNSTHLFESYDEWQDFDGDIKHLTGNRTIECQRDCINDQCLDWTGIPEDYKGAGILAMTVIMLMFAFLSVGISREEHGIMQVLFLAVALIVAMLVSSLVSNIMGMIVTIWTFVLVVFYLIITFIWNILHMILDKMKERKNSRLGINPDFGEKKHGKL